MRDLKSVLVGVIAEISALQALSFLILLVRDINGSPLILLGFSLLLSVAGGIFLISKFSNAAGNMSERLNAVISGKAVEIKPDSFAAEIEKQLNLVESSLKRHTGQLEELAAAGADSFGEASGDDNLSRLLNEAVLNLKMTLEHKESMLEMSRQSIGGLKDMIKELSATSANLSNVSFNMAGAARSMKDRTGSISDSVSVVSSNLDTVASGAEESSIVISNIVKSSKDIAKNIDRISLTVQDLSSSFREITSNTEEAGKISELARSRGDEINEKMASLSEASERIGKVIIVIKKIADQTNMLALNATIEAAGAGEAGKGFAVVANEVKELARQSSESADDIREIIENIQMHTSEVEDAAKEVSAIIKEVAHINKIIADAVDEQRTATANISNTIAEHTSITRDVSVNVEEMSNGATEIARSTTDAADRVRRITENIRDIDVDSTNTARGVEENNSAVKKLISIAQSIQQLVDKSGIKADGSSDIPDLFPWSEKYSVGVSTIDTQHKKLIGMINELNAAMVSEKDFKVLDDIVTRMLEYTIYHFSSEEDIMTSAGYPEFERHKQEHVKLIDDVQGYYNMLKSGEIDTPAVLSFLKDWLNNHILKVDMEYSSHLQSMGYN